MKTRKRIKTRKTKRRKSSWVTNQNKFKKKSLKTKCGKRGGKYPTKKTCPKECDFIDMGSGGTYCNPKKKKQKGGESLSEEINRLFTEAENAISKIKCGGIRGCGSASKENKVKIKDIISSWKKIDNFNTSQLLEKKVEVNSLMDKIGTDKSQRNKNSGHEDADAAIREYFLFVDNIIKGRERAKKFTNKYGPYAGLIATMMRYKAPK